MDASQIDLAAFHPEHLPAAAGLSRAAGWMHRQEDWALTLSLGRGAVAVLEGRVVGTIVPAVYGEQAATVSGVIVDEKLRGRGVGRRLMEWAVQEAGARACRLVATKDGQPLYERVGFRAVGEVWQHQGELGTVAAPAGVRWADADAMARFAVADRSAYGADRSALIAALSEQGQVATLEDGAGFGALRRFGRGEVAGPVVARDLAGAQALLTFLFASRPGVFMRVDTAETAVASWVEGFGLARIERGTAMLRGLAAPAAPEWHGFALASQALG